MRTARNIAQENEFSKPQKPSQLLGKYLFSSDFIRANKDILKRYLSNNKSKRTSVNEFNQGRNLEPVKLAASSSINNAKLNPRKESSKPLLPTNSSEQRDWSVKVNLQKEISSKQKIEHRKHTSTKSVILFPSNAKSLADNLLPDIVPAHRSNKKYSVIEAYSAVTHQGLIRNYNEDRVSIVLNLEKPYNKAVSYWPSITFFGLYDGHGGAACAEYLRDHLHYFVNH